MLPIDVVVLCRCLFVLGGAASLFAVALDVFLGGSRAVVDGEDDFHVFDGGLEGRLTPWCRHRSR